MRDSFLTLLASTDTELTFVASLRDDPLLRSLDEEDSIEQRCRDYTSTSPSIKSPVAPLNGYGFGDFKTLSPAELGLSSLHPSQDSALKLMHELATDWGIVQVMRSHKWRVGILTEMPPVGKVGVSPRCILGFNRNRGQEISLRLRTDDLKGFRKYETIRATLIHELAHMVFDEHDNDFKALNSRLTKESLPLASKGQRVGLSQGEGSQGDGLPEAHVLGGRVDSRVDPKSAAALAAMSRQQQLSLQHHPSVVELRPEGTPKADLATPSEGFETALKQVASIEGLGTRALLGAAPSATTEASGGVDSKAQGSPTAHSSSGCGSRSPGADHVCNPLQQRQWTGIPAVEFQWDSMCPTGDVGLSHIPTQEGLVQAVGHVAEGAAPAPMDVDTGGAGSAGQSKEAEAEQRQQGGRVTMGSSDGEHLGKVVEVPQGAGGEQEQGPLACSQLRDLGMARGVRGKDMPGMAEEPVGEKTVDVSVEPAGRPVEPVDLPDDLSGVASSALDAHGRLVTALRQLEREAAAAAAGLATGPAVAVASPTAGPAAPSSTVASATVASPTAEAIAVMKTILRNALAHPGEGRYCTVRKNNRRIQATLGRFPAALDYLHVAGFRDAVAEGGEVLHCRAPDPGLLWLACSLLDEAC